MIKKRLSTQIFKTSFEVLGEIGSGGQGTVFRVKTDTSEKALKIYNSEYATDLVYTNLQNLIRKGAPKGDVASRFIWPEDIVKYGDSFGYIMPLIDTAKYVSISEITSGHVKSLDFAALCRCSYLIVEAMSALHRSGYIYRDISDNNFKINTLTGDVVVFDNDNVGIQGVDFVGGTFPFMAPELVCIEHSKATTESDLYSLSILLFNLWTGWHPMHGALEDAIHILDEAAQKKLYHYEPVFIFDPLIKKNRPPINEEYKSVYKFWDSVPTILKNKFIISFTDGIRNPNARIREPQWMSLFESLRDSVVVCPFCRAENVWDSTDNKARCWHCEKFFSIPARLIVKFDNEVSARILLSNGALLLERHISSNRSHKPIICGKVIRHPDKQNVFGLQNLTSSQWIVTLPSGDRLSIDPEKSILILPKVQIKINDADCYIEW